MGYEHYTSEKNLKDIERRIGNGEPYTANKDQTLKMIRTIKRLRMSERRRVAYETAAEKFILQGESAGYQELEDLLRDRMEPEKVNEGYLSRLHEMVAVLSN